MSEKESLLCLLAQHFLFYSSPCFILCLDFAVLRLQFGSLEAEAFILGLYGMWTGAIRGQSIWRNWQMIRGVELAVDGYFRLYGILEVIPGFI